MMNRTKEYRKKLADEFLSVLEEKQLDWKKEWNVGDELPVNAITRQPYKGSNRFYLMLIEKQRGYKEHRWATYYQIQKQGWQLENAKGQGIKVEYWYPYDKKEKRRISWEKFKEIEEEFGERYLLLAEYHTIFNADLIKGIAPLPMSETEKREIVPDEFIHKLSKNMDVEIVNDGGGRAFYSAREDKIHLPVPEAFKSEYAYDSTALHELTHATAAEKRLKRDLSGKFGTEKYAFEELIAEITSCFMSVHIKIEQTEEHIRNHKAYVQSWIQEIKEKPEMLTKAIAEAEKAAAYMEHKGELITLSKYENIERSSVELEPSKMQDVEEIRKEANKVYTVAAERQIEQNKRTMEQTIKESLLTFDRHPEEMADFFQFSSRFYKHSLKNSLLIYSSNPDALYCQSYEAWNYPGRETLNNLSYQIKRNEKGIKVYVPVEATILKIDDRLVPLEQATKEEQIRYQAGEIESITRIRHDGIKTVFDVAQTIYPVRDYEKLVHVRYPYEQFEQVKAGMIDCIQNLGYQVKTDNDLEQTWDINDNIVSLQNSRLEDQISGLAEGYSKLVTDQSELSKEQQVFRTAAMGVLIKSYIGIEITAADKENVVQAYKGIKGNTVLFREIEGVFQEARSTLPDMIEKIEQNIKSSGKIERRIQKEPNIVTRERTNREIYEEIKRQVQITDYARENGFTLVRKGRYYSLKEYDSIIIDTERNCYWRNSVPGSAGAIGQGDSVIGFAANFVHNGDMHEALKELSNRIYLPEKGQIYPIPKGQQEKNIEKQLTLPERSENMRRVYAYLTKTRFLDPEIVQDFVNRKMLYQDVNGNCTFVSYSSIGKPEFVCLRGTLSDKKFIGDIQGSNYKRGFYIDNNADKLIVTESVIDAMSVMSILHGQGEDYKGYDYLPLNGTGKHEALMERLKEKPKQEVLLALDHDLSGVENMSLIKSEIEAVHSGCKITYHVPDEKYKDWNEELADQVKKFKPVESISFLKDMELPKIHYCAIQSTKEVEERGFKTREGKEQYRLVELDGNGDLTPVKITERNVLFFSDKEVRKLIPRMYKEIRYEELMGMKAAQIEKVKEPLQIEKFEVTEGILQAKILYKGKEQMEAVWKEGEKIYICTGTAYEKTLERHLLSEEQVEDFTEFINKNDLELNEEYPILQVKKKSMRNEQYLDDLQKTEQNKNLELEKSQGIEMEIGM